jgi:hypothetical protein
MPERVRPLAAPYRREGDTVLVEIKLRETRQLFNSLDPAPFIEKDLDDDAYHYIVDAVGEMRRRVPKKLVFYLPPEQIDLEDARSLPHAVHAYFAYRAAHAATQLRGTLRDGVVALVIGVTFLFTCLTLRQFTAPDVGPAMHAILEEGLLIMGWVAMWGPIQTFLYDWWPILRRRRLLTEISTLPIEIRPRERAQFAAL